MRSIVVLVNLVLVNLAIIVLVLTSSFTSAAAQPPLAVESNACSSAQAPSAPTAQKDNDALRKDIERMRALVQQMETNLAFVDTTQSPLKHQFQLEIDMWKTLINQMERRLDASNNR